MEIDQTKEENGKCVGSEIKFEAYAIQEQTLQNESVPDSYADFDTPSVNSLAIANNNSNDGTLNSSNYIFKKDLRIREQRCCVKSCLFKKRQNPNIKLFSFPDDPNEQKEWAELCNITCSDDRKYVICSKHFEPHLYGKRMVKKNARPSLFLNEVNTNQNAVVLNTTAKSSVIKSVNSNNSSDGVRSSNLQSETTSTVKQTIENQEKDCTDMLVKEEYQIQENRNCLQTIAKQNTKDENAQINSTRQISSVSDMMDYLLELDQIDDSYSSSVSASTLPSSPVIVASPRLPIPSPHVTVSLTRLPVSSTRLPVPAPRQSFSVTRLPISAPPPSVSTLNIPVPVPRLPPFTVSIPSVASAPRPMSTPHRLSGPPSLSFFNANPQSLHVPTSQNTKSSNCSTNINNVEQNLSSKIVQNNQASSVQTVNNLSKETLDNLPANIQIKNLIPPVTSATIPHQSQSQSQSLSDHTIRKQRPCGNTCCICHESRRTNPYIKLFTVPTNPEKRKRWAALCNIDWRDPRRKLVCSKHFKDLSIGKRKIKGNLMPTLFLNNQPSIDKPDQLVSVSDIIKARDVVGTEQITRSNISNNKKAERLAGNLCCICHQSRRTNPNIKLFKMPTEPEKRKQWAAFCNVDWRDTRQRLVCDKHFTSLSFGKKKVKGNAVPTLFVNDPPHIDKPDQLVSVSDIIKAKDVVGTEQIRSNNISNNRKELETENDPLSTFSTAPIANIHTNQNLLEKIGIYKNDPIDLNRIFHEVSETKLFQCKSCSETFISKLYFDTHVCTCAM